MNTGNGKWRALLHVILLGGCASLGGCGKDGNGNGNSPGFSDPTAAVTIQSYDIVGNQPLLTIPQIDSANSAPFLVNWTITGNNVYTAHVFVSANATLDANDIEILVGCGKTASSPTCSTNSVSYSCSFLSSRSTPPSNNPTVVCNDPLTGGSFTAANLSLLSSPSWTLGSTAYIILQACNQASGSCPAVSPESVKQVRYY